MFQKILSHPFIHVVITAAAVGGIFICVFPRAIPHMSWLMNYAVQLMLLYLVAGLVFLAFKQPRLTFVMFGGCLMLNFHLKYAVQNDGIERWRQTVIKKKMPELLQETELKIAQVNLSNASEVGSTLATLRSSGADLLSIHEVTPDWDQWLRDSLSGVYPYHHTYVDIGLFGIAIYARYPLKQIDTFYYQEIPNLKGCIQVGEEELCFVSVHTEPALNSYSLKRLQQHLSRVASESRSMGGHTVVMGEFNAVSWSGEIQTFMDSTGLLESRVGFMQQPVSLLDIPLDHIFFSRNLQCIDFRSVKSPSSRHLGILGVYQFRQFLYHAKKTAQ